MNNRKAAHFYTNSSDFLRDDLFVYWRIHPTQELEDYWNTFILEYPELKPLLAEAKQEFEKIRDLQTIVIEEGIRESIEEELHKRIYRHKTKKIRRFYSISAAAVLAALIVSAIFMRNLRTDSPEEVFIGEIIDKNEIQLLSGNNRLNLKNNAKLDLSEKKNNMIIEDSISQTEIELKENEINKLIVPFGQRTSLILADGSKVYVNSGSVMEFPSAFSPDSREIKIEGELFIEVAKRNNTPFIIHTPHSQIKVLGTSFNVSAYTDDSKESVVLVNGSLQIASNNRSVLLEPNQMAEIHNGNISSKIVDVYEYISWKNGFIQLNKTPLNEVLKKIGRYYNVKFIYPKELSLQTQTCSGKLFLSEDLNDVLNAFSQMTALLYEYEENEGGTIMVRKNSIP
ncbi:FecR family protein [Limibacterium fermenti]|jgi:hypothetical protein|uniref:FecR family protein n=1 Tax=Limibacterium fermenti TaxID=3229863 RepID=UPI003A7AC853